MKTFLIRLLAFNYSSKNINIRRLHSSSRECKQFCEFRNLLLYLFRNNSNFPPSFQDHKYNLALPPRPSANSWLRTFPSSRSYRKLAQKFNGTSGVCTDTFIVCKHLLPTSFIFIESSVVRMESANITIRHIQRHCLHRISMRWRKDDFRSVLRVGELWICWRRSWSGALMILDA